MDSPLSPGKSPALLEHRVPASDCDRIKVCCLSHQVCGNLLQQPQQRTQLTSKTTAWASSLRSAQERLPSMVPSWWFTTAYTFPMAKNLFLPQSKLKLRWNPSPVREVWFRLLGKIQRWDLRSRSLLSSKLLDLLYPSCLYSVLVFLSQQ